MIALDTNLLIYAHRTGAPEHDPAIRAIEKASRHEAGWGIPLPCLAEFWSVVTHPACPPRPSPAEKARAFISGLIEGGAQVWLSGPEFGTRLLQAAAHMRVAGPRVFDLQIAMIAFENGSTELWSHDAQFLSMPGLPVHDPLK